MIEMMVSMVILFMVGVFVMDMFVSGSRQMVRAATNERLSALLNAKVSELRLLPYDSLDAVTLTGAFPAPDEAYQYTIAYDDFAPYSLSDARTLTVTVRHPDTGQMTRHMIRSKVPPKDPGQVAFDKFGCASCHTMAPAGYPDVSGLVPLDRIGDSGPQRPYQAGSGTFEQYVRDAIVNPGDFNSDPDNELIMDDFILEGEPGYDESVDMSTEELDALVTWITSLNNP